MKTAQFEIIMLENGDVALRRSGEDDELVRITFSTDIKAMLGDFYLDVAKEMFDAGIDAVANVDSQINGEQEELEDKPKRLH